jgi:tRNA(Ser,Leu) C12 N-acetylase TAN1
MKDWNLIVTTFQDGFRRAFRSLRVLGSIERTPYHNVLAMKVDDPVKVLEAIELKTRDSTALYDAISRVSPATQSFDFQSAEEFLEKTKSLLVEWSPRLAGRSFHVRLHRRGPKYDLGTQQTEHSLNEAVLDATTKLGTPGKLSFTDPDAVIAIDTIDDRAGVALWTRDDLSRHRLLRPD